MAAPTTLPALLESLTQSLASTHEATHKVTELEKPKDGISLLDVKNELLLSYLQNLVFLILLKIRNSKKETSEEASEIDESVRSKLVELRLYLEKGARPLEEKLRFSIERFLRTAQDAQAKENKKSEKGEKDSDDSESASDDDESEDSEDDGEEGQAKARQAGRSAAPNLGAMTADVTARASRRDKNEPSGVYRPPKRERQLMDSGSGRRDKSDRRPAKSHTMDEFIADELSTAPVAVPSIGTTIVQGGRRMKTENERKEEAERTQYEESNFVRLPAESKKDRAKKNKQLGRSNRMQFGGEEWHDLGQGIDRIDRLTTRKEGGRGGNVRSMLEKSRKRGLETTDGPRGSGMGDRFQKRVKVLESGRRDRGKNR
ncbi:unnamed protein product [Clonostachys rosea]|uniref:Sas10 C-terminal domain-containing protein n=1 Tax=Bionectria ochroleuca TaxID=29856 RepID=A0ABY6UPT5_BIOOC|nr:unnamed protein product [Clonostachys rosea]